MSNKVVLFNDTGWQIATSAWTVGAKGNSDVTLCYPWSAVSGFGFIDNATGTARVKLNLSMADFLEKLRVEGDVVDLRGSC